MKVKNIFVDGQIQPLGIDNLLPTFHWDFAEAEERGTIQTAYRILVSETRQNLAADIGEIWDTGLVRSNRNVGITYCGPTLQSRQRYYWKVQTWDQKQQQSESPISWWEMGLLCPEDWTSQWIGHSTQSIGSSSSAMPLFRQTFTVKKDIKKARVYICGLGHYELRLNGNKVGERVLDTGWTNYDKTCLYSVYDVTAQLQVHENVLGVLLGNGFYNVTGGRYTKFKNSFGLPKCRVQLEIEYKDGSFDTITSDREWMTSQGPITFSCIYGGEDYDARLEQDGWDKPGFTLHSKWQKATEVQAPLGKLSAQKHPPLKVMQTLKPVNVSEPLPHVFIIDFGQNFSGWVRIKVKGKRGETIKLSPGELLNKDGTVNQQASGAPYTFNYVLRGETIEVWEPRFSYYGFRFLQIEGAIPKELQDKSNEQAQLLDVHGQIIYPDIQKIGDFSSSNTLINQTHQLINWAMVSNMKSVLTDCPHREKLGWLEQVHLMGPSLMYNFSLQPLLEKIIADISDSQLDNGMIPTIAPEYVAFKKPWDIFRHSVSWGATYIIIPWRLYQIYGTTQILKQHYQGMKKYIDYLTAKADNFIIQDGLGDWYDVGKERPGFSQNTPVALPETAMLYHVVQLFQQIADLLGQREDSRYYQNTAKQIKQQFNDHFYHPNTHQYGTGSQTSQAMPLALGLVDKANQKHVFQHLVQDILKHDYHTTAGDIGFRFVLATLRQYGRSDIIYKMTQKTDHPSYGFQILNGATSLTEAWDGPVVGTSQNHFMLGHIEEWFYKGLAGITYELNPITGTTHITLAPYLEKELKRVSAQHRLVSGLMSVKWEWLSNTHFQLEVRIPVNCHCTVSLPAKSLQSVYEKAHSLQDISAIRIKGYENGRALFTLASGHYHFTAEV
ncbi:hydrolase [Pullulanibacillus camelliae]|uniref:alpha-L-rhamnosidase n=1 Tax=Pullulanibacillus camelliae TaxID=1707096 RepID=A0A8J2YLZ7_9BACL|nr:alpha-L-rhamnosidase [Pullulanibacillus camelliae]GGE52848.1 hydrolase [Pullulanibacillus camelliae]